MDTKQKNREETRQPRKRPARSEEAGARKQNGAVRTAQERPAAERRAKPEQKAPAGKTGKKPAQPGGNRKAATKKGLTLLKKNSAPKADPEDISGKKRSYGKTKPKQTPITKMQDSMRRSAERREDRRARQGKKPKSKQPTPAVIYTQPAAFNRNRLTVQLLTVTAVVLALVLGVSVFFKVEHITVSGAEVYSEWAIQEASGLKGGENLLTFSRPRAGALIKANLPYVDKVRFGIKLPDTVNIIVEEDDVVYAIKDQTGTWWLMNSTGRVVELGSDTQAAKHTQVLGVTLESPMADQRGVAQEAEPMQTGENGEIIPVTVTGAQRLTAALNILQALEENGIVGKESSVDVGRKEEIQSGLQNCLHEGCDPAAE